jgi:hypothetical protein
MIDSLFLRPSLHCYTSLHFTTLHPNTLHYTYRHFTSSHLHFNTLSFGLTMYISYRSLSPHITKPDTVQFSHLETYFQNNEPLHCPKDLSPFHCTSLFFSFILPILHFTLLRYAYLQLTSLHFTSLHFLLIIAFTSSHWFSLS